MERAHVLVRLTDGDTPSSVVGISRTSATTVRLEHSDMSPGVASITFEQVFDACESNTRVFQTSLIPAIDGVIDGKASTLIATGAAGSGKSFACHGDKHKPSNGKAETGLITQVIRRVFAELERKIKDGTKFNVLLSCWGVGRCVASKNDALIDLLEAGKYVELPVRKMEEKMVKHSVVVETPAEAVHLYSRAVGKLTDAEKQDFVMALHVETLSPDGEARRGRLLVIDIHGSSIVEPRGNKVEKERSQDTFLDAQFPVNEALSAGFGAFVGNTSSTYLLVPVQTPAQFQQQAIQSLLYACKAKEIKSSSDVNYLASFVERKSRQPMRQSAEAENQTPGCREDYVAPVAPPLASAADRCAAFFSGRSLPHASPSMSTTSSDSTCELPFVAPEPAASPSLSTHTSCESEASHKQSVVSQRVRRAYDLAKAGTTSPAKHSAPFVPKCNHCDDADVHTVVNELLKHLSPETLSDLSLEGKLGHIRTTQVELELALAHETSIKDKCVDRISRLSQTMSCQVVEHEEQLHEALTAKHAAEAQLQDLRLKFDDVGREVSHLQGEIKALKAGQNGMTDSEDDGRDSAVRNDRVMLHTLSARLEEAMIQAKDVITFKDGAIQSLEERLQLASKRGADAVTMLDEAKVRFEREKAELLAQLQHNKESCDSVNNAEVSRLQTQNAAIQQQKAELTVKVAQLTLELETARAQWAQEAEARERRAEERCAKQITHAEQQLEQATAAMQQQMAEFRAELDTKVARQRVAAQVACKAGQLRRQQLERELQRMKLKLAKQKAKLEKKARALVANAHKQHERPVAELQTELEELSVRFQTVLESEQDASRRARSSEETTHRLRAEMEQLQRSGGEVERERSALRNLCKELETNKAALKAEFDQRIHEMEQSLATQVKAAETRVHEERDGQMQTLIEQHEAQLNRLKTEAESTKSPATFARKKSPSSASSRSSEGSDGSRQKSIEELDALIDSKERRYRHLEGKREAPSLSPRPAKSSTLSLKRALAQRGKQIADLSAREKQLLVALATANEQETLAKRRNQEIEGRRRQELAQHEDLLQQLNSVKRENWSLSLALHVTEATNHQQQRGPVSSSPMY